MNTGTTRSRNGTKAFFFFLVGEEGDAIEEGGGRRRGGRGIKTLFPCRGRLRAGDWVGRERSSALLSFHGSNTKRKGMLRRRGALTPSAPQQLHTRTHTHTHKQLTRDALAITHQPSPPPPPPHMHKCMTASLELRAAPTPMEVRKGSEIEAPSVREGAE